MLSTMYAAIARRRREWYARRPDRRRRLRRPVISIGNIAVGGRGKTPFTASVARLLVELGERPALLSRGYARAATQDGAVVVRDAGGIRADVERSGDEPFMLARQLEGAIVVSSPDRYVGGRIAEQRLGATVHLLDDGFQHFELDRDADIVLVAPEDLRGRTLPGGRLREPPDVLICADAVVALGDMPRPAVPDAFFTAHRRTSGPVFNDVRPRSGPVFAIAGIAGPESFFDALAAAGVQVCGTRAFRDHHAYTVRDVRRIVAAARDAGASAILTTEKDYVRLLRFRPFALPVGYLPLTMDIEPLEAFRAWLVEALAAARDQVLV